MLGNTLGIGQKPKPAPVAAEPTAKPEPEFIPPQVDDAFRGKVLLEPDGEGGMRIKKKEPAVPPPENVELKQVDPDRHARIVLDELNTRAGRGMDKQEMRKAVVTLEQEIYDLQLQPVPPDRELMRGLRTLLNSIKMDLGEN